MTAPDTAVDRDRALDRLLDRWVVEAPTVSRAGAAVTLLLREGRDDIETLLIERAVRAGDLASGQVGLPGGRVEARDPTLAATALRELDEEVGLVRDDLEGGPRFLFTQPAPIFGLDVAVFAAPLRQTGHPPTARSPHEVAHVFWLPASTLHDPQRVLRETPAGPREVDALLHDGHVIWGFTLRVLQRFFTSSR